MIRAMLIALAAVGGANLLQAAPAVAEAVRDANSRVIGYVDQVGDRTVVRDCNFRILGHADARGTYDTAGRKLFQQPVPALLLEQSPCRAPAPTPRQ